MKSKHTSFIIMATLILMSGCKGGINIDSPFKPFESHLSEYTSIANLKDSSPTETPYIVGKVIPIRRGEYEIDWHGGQPGFEQGSYAKLDKPVDVIDKGLHSLLPSDLRASTPEEVKTVIWLEGKRNVVGRYTDGKDAYQFECKLTIIDRTRNTIVVQKTFLGDSPPEKTLGRRYGDLPLNEIRKYITELPRR